MRKLFSAGVAVAALAQAACAALPLPLAVGQPASFVIGQPGLQAGETGPSFLANSWGHATILDGRLFIGDTGASRIWMFDSVPNATRASPDALLGGDPGADRTANVVLGQQDFTSAGSNRGRAGEGSTSAATLCAGSARWLVFTSQRPRTGASD